MVKLTSTTGTRSLSQSSTRSLRRYTMLTQTTLSSCERISPSKETDRPEQRRDLCIPNPHGWDANYEQITKIMLSFLKRKITAQDIGQGIAARIQNRFGSNSDNKLLPDNPAVSPDIVRDEWLHFEVFCFDYSTYLAFGEIPTRKAIAHHFWSSM